MRTPHPPPQALWYREPVVVPQHLPVWLEESAWAAHLHEERDPTEVITFFKISLLLPVPVV